MRSQFVMPLILAVSSLPAFAAAVMIARGQRASGTGWPLLSRVMLMVGLAILGGAAGLLWAGDNDTRRLAVIVAMALVVNGLGIALLVGMARNRNRRR
jgi:hypothetical protein